MSKIKSIYEEVGISGLCWRGFSYLYKHYVRPILPASSPILYSGITVGYRRTFDGIVFPKLFSPPAVYEDISDYEGALVAGLKANIRGGDTVVVVGGGLGVTAITAALAVETNGCVRCFEGDLDSVHTVIGVASINGVSDRLSVRHEIVGEDIEVWGSAKAATVVRPNELPACDILELDCEGAELGVLREMTIQPRVVVVETHGFLHASTSEVRSVLESRGYLVQDLGWAEPRFVSYCRDRDIRVLVGKKIEARH